MSEKLYVLPGRTDGRKAAPLSHVIAFPSGPSLSGAQMPRIRLISLCLVFALCWMLGVRCSRPTPRAEPPWLEIHSAHFTVITDAGDKKGREVALRFEQMRSVFASLLTKDRLNQSVPLTILAFKNDKTLLPDRALCAKANLSPSPGFFLSGEDQDFIVLNLFEAEPWRAVAHDFAEMLLTYNYPPSPGWFDFEGPRPNISARFTSTTEPGRNRRRSRTSPFLTEDLVGNQRETQPPKSLTELLGNQVWLPLPDLFTLKHDPSTRNQGTHHTLFYMPSHGS